MRLLLIGATAVVLSGCSWFGGSNHGTSHSANQGYYSGGATSANPCCGKLSKWNIEAGGGPAFLVGGDAFSGTTAVGVTASDQSMKDVFDPGVRYELGGSYALNPNRKVTLTGSYAKAKGEAVNLGTYGGNTLTGDVSDYEGYGAELGLRQYFKPGRMPLVKAIRPYVEGKVGVSKMKDITLENAAYGGAVENGGTIGLYEGGWVPTAAGMVGVEAPIFKRATLGLETGIRYTGHLDSDTSYLNGTHALTGVNNGSESFTVPVTLRGRYRF